MTPTAGPLRAHVDPLALRAALGREQWLPPRPIGNHGWGLGHRTGDGSIIVSILDTGRDDQPLWIHASMNRRGRCPSYEDLTQLHLAAFTGWAYQVFPPPEHHINDHEYCLHLWGRLDGAPALPDLAPEGTI